MSRRRSKTVPPCNVPLAVPGSLRVERCYAMHGKGWIQNPGWNARVELVLIDDSRDVWNVLGFHPEPRRFHTDAVDCESGWRILGWRMADGSKPHGEYDYVDPELAQIDRLPQPNPAPVVAHSISCHPPGSPLIAHPMLMT